MTTFIVQSLFVLVPSIRAHVISNNRVKNHNCNIDECSSILVISSFESNFADTVGRQSSTNRPFARWRHFTTTFWVCVGGGESFRVLLSSEIPIDF